MLGLGDDGVSPSVWQAAAAILTAAGTVLSIYYGGRAIRAKTEADRGTRELEGVKVSVDSLQAALAQANEDNTRLRDDVNALREELRLHRQSCNARITVLAAQVVELGGIPNMGVPT